MLGVFLDVEDLGHVIASPPRTPLPYRLAREGDRPRGPMSWRSFHLQFIAANVGPCPARLQETHPCATGSRAESFYRKGTGTSAKEAKPVEPQGEGTGTTPA